MLDAIAPGGRDRRLVSAILVLGTIVLFFVAVNLAASAIGFFGDVLLAFFLAWLLAFIISPVVTRIVDLIPRLPRVLATVLVYTLIVALLVFLILVIAQALSNSITQFAASLPNIRADIGIIVAPTQGWLDSIGLGQVDLATQALAILDNLDEFAAQLIVPLQSIAVASVGAIGTMLIVFILSIYMVIDRDQIMAFLFRLVPPSYAEEARLLQTSVARSFGGFLRGQALMGIVYFAIALATHLGLGLELHGTLVGQRRGPHGYPVLRSVPGLGTTDPRRARHQARRAAAGGGDHGRRLDGRDERAPAADHAGRRRHPSDRRARVGADRVEDRRHPGCDLRDPGRSRRVVVLLPLPSSDGRRPVRGRPGGEAAERARGATGHGAARAEPGSGRRRPRDMTDDTRRPRTSLPTTPRRRATTPRPRTTSPRRARPRPPASRSPT